jgi:integrase
LAIYKSSKGYSIRWYDADGRERQKTYKGVTRDEAVKLEREMLAARDRGERPLHDRDAPTFDTVATAWIEERRSEWKTATREQYEQILARWLRPRFGARRITDITDSEGRQFRTAMVDHGLSPRRINLMLLVLKMVLKHARRYLREDPLRDVKRLREPKVEIDPLAPEEIERFLAESPRWWRPYFTVAFWTGARPNELAALKWGDLDSVHNSFRIRAGRYKFYEESTPKTPASVRDVACLAPVTAAFKAQRVQQAAARIKAGRGMPEPGRDYIFTGRDGGLLNVPYIRQIWYDTLRRAELRRRTMYQTRHSFASNALAAGEDPSWIARQLGHTSTEMLFKVYGRFIPNRTRRDGSALLARMSGQPSDTGKIRAFVGSEGGNA